MIGQEELEFANDVRAALEQGAPRKAWRLILTILAAMGVGTAWAAIATVDEVTSGQGRVIPSSQLQVVQTLEGGIVRKILVREGDSVDADQILVQIDDTGFASKLGELRARRQALLAELIRLEAEAGGQSALNPDTPFAQEAPKQFAAAQNLFHARRAKLNEDVVILRQQLIQQRQKLAESEAKASKLSASLEPLEKEVDLTRKLYDRGVVPEIEFLRLTRQSIELKGDLKIVEATIPGDRANIAEVESRIKNVEATFKAQAGERLAQIRAEYAIVNESIRAADDRVSRTLLRAPVRGIVNKLNVNTLGAVVQPGRDIIEIVPVDDTLLIEAKVRPQDVAFVGPNDAANIKLTAYDYTVYGSLAGQVERISADTITDDQDETFYRVTIRTDRTNLLSNGHNLPIIPGMVAQVDILTGKKTVLDYLLKPISRTRSEAFRER